MVTDLGSSTVYLRMNMAGEAHATFEYSTDDKTYDSAGSPLIAEPGIWISAKLGLFAQGQETTGENGYLDVDWFRLTK